MRQQQYPRGHATDRAASGACNTNWSGGSVSGLGALLSSSGCTPNATELRCSFLVLLGGIASPSVSITAPQIGYSFRSFNPADVRIQVNGGPPQSVTVQNYSSSVSSSSGGVATVSFQIVFPLLSVADSVVVIVPHPKDAFQADARMQWFLTNGWDRFVYYSVARAVTSDAGADVCTSSVFTDCLTVNGLPSPANNKRLALILMGPRASAGQTWPGSNVNQYLEAQNSTPADRIYEVKPVDTAFNDRIATCPFQETASSGSVTLCN